MLCFEGSPESDRKIVLAGSKPDGQAVCPGLHLTDVLRQLQSVGQKESTCIGFNNSIYKTIKELKR